MHNKRGRSHYLQPRDVEKWLAENVTQREQKTTTSRPRRSRLGRGERVGMAKIERTQ